MFCSFVVVIVFCFVFVLFFWLVLGFFFFGFALPQHIEPLAGTVIPQGEEGLDERREGKLWDRAAT